mgnify:CR=1 FL=1
MSYVYDLGAEGKFSANSNAHGILGSISCDITQTDSETVINFSDRNMSAMACQAYVDPFRQSGISAQFDNSDGQNKIILTGDNNLREYRDVSSRVAGYALKINDQLGQDFVAEVMKVGAPQIKAGGQRFKHVLVGQ